MAQLTKNNCLVDPKSGGVVFTGSPEMRAIRDLSNKVDKLHVKIDVLIKLLEGVNENGRKVETSRFS